MPTTQVADTELRKQFRHEAFLYRGEDDFLGGTTTFVRDALAAAEPVLLAISAAKADRLRAELRDDLAGRTDDVLFADMAELGRNPARIIPAWRDYLSSHGHGGRVRGVGEPVWAGRTRAELLETQRHEVLLSMAFSDLDDFWLLCPYDVEILHADVIEEAFRSHRYVLEGGVTSLSELHEQPTQIPAHLDDPLDDPPPHAALHVFADGDLSDTRHLVATWAAAYGLRSPRSDLLVLALNELTTNSIEHGGGKGELLLWAEPHALVAEVRDGGYMHEPLVGRVRPDQVQGGGRGVWLVNQVCDLVEIRTSPAGTVARVRMEL